VAAAALAATGEDELAMAATSRAEVLVGPLRVGGGALRAATDFVDACSTVPVSEAIADAAAALRARHRALSLPDAIALAVAELVDADAVWTFDRRWTGVDPRVRTPERGGGSAP